MLFTSTITLVFLANAMPTQVGYGPLLEGRNEAAVRELEGNAELDENDPVKLINLGVAYARQGREEEARAMFEAAMHGADRQVLETASGEWKDSRHLARQAIKLLDRGEFRSERMAAR